MPWWCGYSQSVSFSRLSGLPNFKNDLVFSFMSITIPSPRPKWTNLLFCRSLQCEAVTQNISDLIYHYFPLHTLALLTLGVRISRCCAVSLPKMPHLCVLTFYSSFKFRCKFCFLHEVFVHPMPTITPLTLPSSDTPVELNLNHWERYLFTFWSFMYIVSLTHWSARFRRSGSELNLSWIAFTSFSTLPSSRKCSIKIHCAQGDVCSSKALSTLLHLFSVPGSWWVRFGQRGGSREKSEVGHLSSSFLPVATRSYQKLVLPFIRGHCFWGRTLPLPFFLGSEMWWASVLRAWDTAPSLVVFLHLVRAGVLVETRELVVRNKGLRCVRVRVQTRVL